MRAPGVLLDADGEAGDAHVAGDVHDAHHAPVGGALVGAHHQHGLGVAGAEGLGCPRSAASVTVRSL
ncbi:MAG: hypothetical protein U0325_30875 [Polyangiales bacterium]